MTATQGATDWRSLAACMSADPDLFFPISSAGPALQQVSQAKAICARCGVQRDCLKFALATGQVHGVWGGTTEEERVLMRRRFAARAVTSPIQGAARQTPRQRAHQAGGRQSRQRPPGR